MLLKILSRYGRHSVRTRKATCIAVIAARERTYISGGGSRSDTCMHCYKGGIMFFHLIEGVIDILLKGQIVTTPLSVLTKSNSSQSALSSLQFYIQLRGGVFNSFNKTSLGQTHITLNSKNLQTTKVDVETLTK